MKRNEKGDSIYRYKENSRIFEQFLFQNSCVVYSNRDELLSQTLLLVTESPSDRPSDNKRINCRPGEFSERK